MAYYFLGAKLKKIPASSSSVRLAKAAADQAKSAKPNALPNLTGISAAPNEFPQTQAGSVGLVAQASARRATSFVADRTDLPLANNHLPKKDKLAQAVIEAFSQPLQPLSTRPRKENANTMARMAGELRDHLATTQNSQALANPTPAPDGASSLAMELHNALAAGDIDSARAPEWEQEQAAEPLYDDVAPDTLPYSQAPQEPVYQNTQSWYDTPASTSSARNGEDLYDTPPDATGSSTSTQVTEPIYENTETWYDSPATTSPSEQTSEDLYEIPPDATGLESTMPNQEPTLVIPPPPSFSPPPIPNQPAATTEDEEIYEPEPIPDSQRLTTPFREAARVREGEEAMLQENYEVLRSQGSIQASPQDNAAPTNLNIVEGHAMPSEEESDADYDYNTRSNKLYVSKGKTSATHDDESDA